LLRRERASRFCFLYTYLHRGDIMMRHRFGNARLVVAAALTVAVVGRGQNAAAQAPTSVLGVPCDKITELGIDKQENLRAGLIRIGCGVEPGGDPDLFEAKAGVEGIVASANVNVITGTETYPKVTQSESMVWASPDGSTIVVNYNDSNTAPDTYSGVSVSTDGGATFSRLRPAPFATGHGRNYGDPVVVYNVALGEWFAGDMATGCGGQGVGLWTSTDALNWKNGACAHQGSSDDRESMWVDNNPNSPYFGRMYISWNDFAAQIRIFVTRSDDGENWSSALGISAASSNVIRNIQLTGSPEDGTVFIVAMDEGPGGGLSNRQNIVYRSTDGGDNWTRILM